MKSLMGNLKERHMRLQGLPQLPDVIFGVSLASVFLRVVRLPLAESVYALHYVPRRGEMP